MKTLRSSQQVLTLEISEEIVSLIAPKEKGIFIEIADAYFEDPNKFIQSRNNDEAHLGLGINETLSIATPAIIVAVETVINYIGVEILKVAKEEAVGVLRERIKELFSSSGVDKGISFDHTQLELIKSLAQKKAMEHGMKPDKAKQMAEALIGSIVLKTN